MNTSNQKLRVCELFAGIGGFRLGIEQALGKENVEFVYVSEWDKYAAQIYNKNFNADSQENRGGAEKEKGNKEIDGKGLNRYERSGMDTTRGQSGEYGNNREDKGNACLDTRDIRTVPTSEIPDHDLLVGGFPCQAFSIAGKRRGFEDTRGTLFFEIARILKDKHPSYFILENVKGLLSHDGGRTFKTIITTLTELGYDLQWQVLNSKNFGVPQNRERVFIVGHIRGQPRPEVFPITENNSEDIILPTVTSRVTADSNGTYVGKRQTQETESGGQANREKRVESDTTNIIRGETHSPSIRRLTPTECERLQGFPDGWTEGISDTQRYKCLGNAVTTNVVYEVARRLENDHPNNA